MSAREQLVGAAKRLVWEQGVEATSPADLLAASGIGQGSLYHHFAGKSAWAGAAISALADDLGRETEELLGDETVPGRERVLAYLTKPRTVMAGCRLGRLAFDPAVLADPVLAAPIRAYAERLELLLERAVADAVRDGELAALHPADTAATIAATVQGGYVWARMEDDEHAMHRALTGLVALLPVPTDRRRDA